MPDPLMDTLDEIDRKSGKSGNVPTCIKNQSDKFEVSLEVF